MSSPAKNLSSLRELMTQHELDAYIIPNTDPHLSEYLPDHWRIVPWFSGFTGSSANIVVTQEEAGLWTDSRYFIQAEEQLNGSGIALHKLNIPHTPGFADWTGQQMARGSRIGIDDRLFSIGMVKFLEEKFSSKELVLVKGKDLISPLWKDRPPMPREQAYAHEEKYTGRSVKDKLQMIRAEMQDTGVSHYLIAALDDIAWTFNIRGNDVPFNPLVVAYALVGKDTATLFIEVGKLPEELTASLAEAGVQVQGYEKTQAALQSLGAEDCLLYSPSHINAHLKAAFPESLAIKEQLSLATILKAIKNEVEQGHIRNVMVKDGIALVKFFMWLEETVGKQKISELSAARQLHAFRAEGSGFVGDSFDTISGYAAHGAIVHYSVTEETDIPLEPKGIFLLDSGGQYFDGTTDITRTVALGPPSQKQKKDFTLVLKGHIELARLIYPEGTKGYQIEAMARKALWAHGFNYGHGTGHGVGFFLNVHEGPQTLGTAARGNLRTALQPGMLTSNEPGLYREGEYGIRTENLVLTVPHKETEFGNFYAFETVSLCPIDTSLIDKSLLEKEEIQWLNAYHQKVFDKLSPHLTAPQVQWLKTKTAGI